MSRVCSSRFERARIAGIDEAGRRASWWFPRDFQSQAPYCRSRGSCVTAPWDQSMTKLGAPALNPG